MVWLLTALARLAQFMGAALLFGAPLFFLYGLPAQGRTAAAGGRWPRPLLAAAAAAGVIGALVLLGAQTATMTGEVSAAFDPSSLWTVLTGTRFGSGLAGRIVVTALALALCLLAPPSRGLWAGLAALGALALASFGWTGHAGAEDGAAGLFHLTADVVHLWAAGVWIGALAVLAVLLTASRRGADDLAVKTLHDGLAGFSGIGAAVVAALVATGLVNSWFLIGPSHLSALWSSTYGLLLVGKLALFAAMLGLAAANRFRLTPALAAGLASGSPDQALNALRKSVLIESAAALAVIVLVSILGTLAPPSSMG